MKQQKFFNALRFTWQRLLQSAAIFRYSDRAISLVWSTSPSLTLIFAVLTLAAGLFPAVIAYVGKLIVDSVINASRSGVKSWELLLVYMKGLTADRLQLGPIAFKLVLRSTLALIRWNK